MELTVNKTGDKTLVALNGRIDTTNAGQFEKDIMPLAEGEKPQIEIDCEHLDYTSSQGLRIFLGLQKTVTAAGGSMVLTKMNPQVKEVFDITGFSSIIKIL